MYNEEYVNLQIDSMPKRDGIALELGANHGMHTRKIAEKFRKVYAFEPHPANIKILRKNTETHHNIEIVEAAVASQNGLIKLYDCPNPGGHTISEGVMGHRIWGHNPEVYHEVRAIALDDFCRGMKIDFMKVDVEGAEDTLFEGAMQTLQLNDMDIIMEVHRFVDLEKLYRLFSDLGYTIFDIDGIGRPTEFNADHHYILTNRKVANGL